MELNSFISDFANLFEETNPSDITASLIYKELDEWDSLIAFSLIAMVKVKYGKSLNGSEIRSCVTLEDLFNLLKSK